MLYIDLRKLRFDNSEMKQSDLADRLGCEQSYISQIESGKRKLSDEMVDKLKSEFGDITPYITEIPDGQLIQMNQNGDNIGGNKILEEPCNKDREIAVLKAKLDSAMDEIKWLRSLVEKHKMGC